MKRCCLYLVSLLLISCGDEDLKMVKYDGYMPNYSVNLPENALESKFQGAVRNYLSSEENEMTLDCTNELNLLNMAPRFPDTPGSNTPICTPDNPRCITSSLGFLIYLYANGLFYDCNIRRQVRINGLDKLCILRSGTNGSIGTGDLCNDNETSSQKMLAYSYIFSPDQSLDDNSLFIAWTMDSINPESGNLEGKVIHRLLNEDGSRSQTRITLGKLNGLKSIGKLEIVDDLSTTNPNILTRIYIRESLSGGNVSENFIVIRRWDQDQQNILAIRAHVRDGEGAVVYMNACPATTYGNAIASTCTARTGSISECFNTDHTSVNCNSLSGMVSSSDTAFNHPNTSIDLDTYLDGQSLSDAFNPDDYSPGNP